jgi:hypothetical protein
MSNITIHDWIPGESSEIFELVSINPVLVASELIELRVRQDVADFNRQKPWTFSGSVRASRTEEILNIRPNKGNRRRVNADILVAAALEGFQSKAFLLFVDERQIEDLSTIIDLSREPKIIFIRLVPLVGG